MTDQQPKPWRQVVHIEHQEGPKGGEYWWLTLECGHHKAVAIPAYRIEFMAMVSFKDTKRSPKKRTAPERCRCLLCALNSDRTQQQNAPANASVS